MKYFILGALVGWVASFVYGWNRRAYYEYKEFRRGFDLAFSTLKEQNAKRKTPLPELAQK